MLENYIRHVHIENFRSLANVDVDLLPLTVLVGANGSGKSNFLGVLKFVRDALLKTPRFAVSEAGGFEKLQSNRSKPLTYLKVGLNLQYRSQEYSYSFSLSPSDDEAKPPKIIVQNERFRVGNDLVLDYRLGTPSGIINASPTSIEGLALYTYSNDPSYSPVYDFLTEQQYYTIFPNNLRQPSHPKDSHRFDADGTNLESALGYFMESRERSIDLVNSLKTIVPHIEAVQLNTTDNHYKVYLRHSDGSRLRLQQESDGTLRVIALLLALYEERSSSSLIAIEEPELAVHPGALGVLVDVIEETALSTQVIITTHSPDLITRFRAENLRIVEWTDEGTQIGPLDERQREVIERQLFGAGDLLRIEGLARTSRDT